MKDKILRLQPFGFLDSSKIPAITHQYGQIDDVDCFYFLCLGRDEKAASSDSINAYARLEQDASWTYREDLVEEDTACSSS